MNSFWSRLYDSAKDRRYGILFFIAFCACFGVFALVMFIRQILGKSDDQNYFLAMLAGGVLVLVTAFTWKAIRIAQRQAKEKFERKELSRDEIVKARSKLVKSK